MSADLNFVMQFIKIFSNNYPECLSKLIIFPFPWWGKAVWALVKPFVDQRTQKVLVVEHNQLYNFSIRITFF